MAGDRRINMNLEQLYWRLNDALEAIDSRDLGTAREVISDLIAKVRDPDEADGLSVTPAILPLAVYGNFETGTFSIVEYHGAPYNQFCIIAFGQGLKLPDYGATK